MIAEVKDKISRLKEEAIMFQLAQGAELYSCLATPFLFPRELWQKEEVQGKRIPTARKTKEANLRY